MLVRGSGLVAVDTEWARRYLPTPAHLKHLEHSGALSEEGKGVEGGERAERRDDGVRTMTNLYVD